MVECREDDYEERGGVLAGVSQMREFLFGIAIATQTLCKAQICWQTSDDWANKPGLANTLVVIYRCAPVTFVSSVETDHILKIQQHNDETIQLVSQPKVGKANEKEWCTESSTLKCLGKSQLHMKTFGWKKENKNVYQFT